MCHGWNRRRNICTLKKITKRKERIIEALYELLDKKDYHDITITRIVDKAELGRRTFYRYFKSKDEVIEYSTNLLMKEFADTIVLNHAETQDSIINPILLNQQKTAPVVHNFVLL